MVKEKRINLVELQSAVIMNVGIWERTRDLDVKDIKYPIPGWIDRRIMREAHGFGLSVHNHLVAKVDTFLLNNLEDVSALCIGMLILRVFLSKRPPRLCTLIPLVVNAVIEKKRILRQDRNAVVNWMIKETERFDFLYRYPDMEKEETRDSICKTLGNVCCVKGRIKDKSILVLISMRHGENVIDAELAELAGIELGSPFTVFLESNDSTEDVFVELGAKAVRGLNGVLILYDRFVSRCVSKDCVSKATLYLERFPDKPVPYRRGLGTEYLNRSVSTPGTLNTVNVDDTDSLEILVPPLDINEIQNISSVEVHGELKDTKLIDEYKVSLKTNSVMWSATT